MLIRFANNPGTTLGEQDFLRSLPDSVDFVVLTNADNLSVYDKEDISKLKRTGTKFLYYKNLSEFYDQCEETENLEEFKTKMNAALKNGESDEFDGYYVQFGRAGSMMHVDFFNEVTTAIREKLALSAVRKLIMESWFSLMASSHLQWIIAEDTKSRSSIW